MWGLRVESLNGANCANGANIATEQTTAPTNYARRGLIVCARAPFATKLNRHEQCCKPLTHQVLANQIPHTTPAHTTHMPITDPADRVARSHTVSAGLQARPTERNDALEHGCARLVTPRWQDLPRGKAPPIGKTHSQKKSA